jgi:hypothetical protein
MDSIKEHTPKIPIKLMKSNVVEHILGLGGKCFSGQVDGSLGQDVGRMQDWTLNYARMVCGCGAVNR